MRIAVIDGQGGGLGKTIIERLRKEFADQIVIVALGTNALATSAMMKAGANEGASGENAIVYSCGKVDIIAGAIGIIVANSMLGEFTPRMTQAIAESPARKVLIPLNRCNVEIVGTTGEPLPRLVDNLANFIRNQL
jgi:NAD(P)-dependent dehydrogenase (short-subunit alcohol dehydrogenase family)